MFQQWVFASGEKPFACDSTYLKIWNGDRYVPFPVKGINFGVAVPGAYPGDLLVTREQYGRWLSQIQEAGFNSIRLYTLHFPSFYEVLDSFNLANPNSPLFIMQGIWLEEDVPGYSNDLFSLTAMFQTEIEENIDCVHGNRNISTRVGKAFGSYTTDASKWVCAYILGREVMPVEVLTSNQLHSSMTSFSGNYFSITNASPVETWITGHLNHLSEYENANYNEVKPLSFSSWPTLDPLYHPEETNRMEDSASIDLASLVPSLLTAGYFVSIHAYPYYPDFISHQQNYQSCTDYMGQNSYICYLEDLKVHYANFPLLIAETGCPSSWGIAHYAQNGIHHGGFDETSQGENNIRLAQNIMDAGCAGSVMFNWMDEWFKRTWITDPVDSDPARRTLWHNVTAAEQNFGLIGFKRNTPLVPWQQFSGSSQITSIEAAADYAYFTMRLHMPPPGVLDTILIALDTYAPSLGESILPNGATVSNRAEFYLSVSNYEAELFVTEAYDLYGVWYGHPAPGQVYRSVVSNTNHWNIVRWQNNSDLLETQYIGHMQVNRLNLPESSLDAVRIDSNYLDIRLPWTLLNFDDPSQMKVIHDRASVSGLQDTVSSGISITMFYKGNVYQPSTRFTWPTWNTVTNTTEFVKSSYEVVRNNLYQLPGGPVAFLDTFSINTSSVFAVPASSGLLSNDYVMAGFNGQAYLDGAPVHGFLFLSSDGGFTFYPEAGYTGLDTFSYRIFSGPHMSEPAKVILDINAGGVWASIYPNPSPGQVSISSLKDLDAVEVYDNLGKCIYLQKTKRSSSTLPLNFEPGIYFARLYSGKEVINKKFVIKN